MTDVLEFSNIYKEDRGAMNMGRMKITDKTIVFKSYKTGKIDYFPKSDFNELNWMRLPTNYCLRVMLKNGRLYRFMGFVESDFENLRNLAETHWDLEITPKEMCLHGWNWGKSIINGSVLSFDIENKSAFEIPLENVSRCTSAKNEVTIEFHPNDAAPLSLMEMRFHIHQGDGSDDRVTALTDAVLSQANIIQATGDAIATFSELQCLTPRGRYDIKLFPTFIQLHGKTFDYKIPLSTVLRLFRLPHKDGRQVFFVLSLDPPIKQGQTRYHFLILLFNKEDEVTVELSLKEKEIKEKYEGKLEKEMSGPTIDVFGQIMKALVQRKITVPGNIGSANSNPAIPCSYRAGAGLLYLLERGFIYVHKPPVHIRFDEIQSINFARSGGSTRSFDFEVETKSGVLHTFSSIEKEEYQKIYDFVSNKKLRVKNRGTEPSTTAVLDDELVNSDDDDEPDAYLARVKHEGKMREEEGDSDESDESFNPDASVSDAGSGDDGSGSSESTATSDMSSGVDEDEEEMPKKKEKVKPKPKPKPKEKENKKEKGKEKEKEKKESKKRQNKKEKDSNKPKRPMSAYFLWLNETREKIKSQYPGLSMTEMTKKAGELWREKVKDKTKWEKEAQEAKKRYDVDMEKYLASGGSTEKTPKKSSSAPRKSKSETKKSFTSPAKSSGNYKSKEFVSDDDSSSSESDKGKTSKKAAKKYDEKSASDVEMASEASASTPESDSD